MTKDQIDTVLERIRSWPQARQEDAVRVLLTMEAQDPSVHVLTTDEEADIDAALDEVARGEIASDAEVAAVFSRKRA
jgi:hypothetical protein